MIMKKFLFVFLLLAACFSAVDVAAQGKYTPKSTGYVLGDTTRLVKVYDFSNLNPVPTSVTVGVYYTKGASEDSTSTVQVLAAVDLTALTAGYGEVISTDATLQYGFSAASEYQEQVITRAGGIPYLAVKIVPVGTATDTTNIKPFIYLK